MKLLRRVLAVVPAVCLGLAGTAVIGSPAHAAGPAIQITEIAYGGGIAGADGGDGEYVELTNEGDAAQDLTGWTYGTGATAPTAPGGVSLTGLGTLQPGESAIITDVSADEFRADWGLKPTVKVVTNDAQVTLNKGPNGAYVFDSGNALIDSVTYVSGAFSGKGDAKTPAAAVSSSELASGWNDETVGDAEGSWTSATDSVGSPGASAFGTSSPADVRSAPAAEDAHSVVKIDDVDATTDTVTLDNTGSSAHDISGWTVQDTAGTAMTIPDGTTLDAGETQTFTATSNTFTASDFAKLYDGDTLVDTKTWTAVDPNSKNITINEVSSDNATADQVAAGDPLSDAIELYNKGDDPVDLTGWKQIDSGDASAATTFGPIYVNGSTTPASDMTVPGHGYAVFSSTKGLGSGGDAVKLYTPDGTLVDSVTYGAGQAGVDETTNTDNTYKALAACPDGGDTYLMVKAYSFGTSNAVPCETGTPPPADAPTSDVPCTTEAPGPTTDPVAGAVTWPGSSEVEVADDQCAWDGGGTQQDLSGLVFDPTDPTTLWAVKNKSVVFKLAKNSDGVWQKVTTDGWADGKNLTFPGGTGLPDSEGMTVGPDGALYITTERDNANNDVPLDTVLRFDPSQSGTTLTATDEWNLTADLGFAPSDSADANLGFEGVTYVPDSYLTANGFIDDNTHTFYKPSTYSKKVTAGLFFAAVEKTGHLEAYALNSDHTFTRVADIDTGMSGVMDVSYDADLHRIWAQCDNTCGVDLTLLKIGSDGHFTPEKHYARPAGLPDNNLEGFAVAPVSTAVNGERETVWSDDGNFGTSTTGVSMTADNGGHSLWSGLMDVDLGLGSQGYQAPVKTGGGGTRPSGNPHPGGTTTATPAPALHPVVFHPVGGKPKVGKKLTVKLTLPSGAKVTYTWFAGGKKIKGAHKRSLKVTKRLKHKRIKVRIVVRMPGQPRVVKVLKVHKRVH